MQFNQKLINDLREGKIAVDDCKKKEMVKSILKETGLPIRNENKHRYYYRNAFGTIVNNFESQGLPIISIAAFLIPEPKFKIGQIVHSCDGNFKILSMDYDDDTQLWFYKLEGVYLMEPEIELEPINGIITESATKTGTEQQFEIGKDYEFSDGEDWVKGKAVGTVDYEGQRNFIADIGGKLSVFENIRPIQPKVITRWINMSQSGNQVGKKCFESEIEACQHAPQSQNVFQVKLTGTYTI